jgi:two-component system OmpR family sensor kinase
VSLRVRLLAGIVVLVTSGLTVAAVATYAEQRSFLYSRLDQQVASARLPIMGQLAREQAGLLPPGFKRRAPGLRFGSGAGAHIDQQLPPGTFGELLGAGGHLLAQPVGYSFEGTTIHPPPLPKHYPVSTLGRPLRLFTFTSNGVGYRAVATGIGLLSGTLFIAVPRRDVDATLHRLIVVELLVGIGVILGLLVLGWFVIRVGLRPLERMRTVATEIAHGDLSRRVSPADGRTEVGRLGESLNEMLAQIERAFAARTDSETRLREFLADASHELRTPLAAVRGYAELYRLGAAREPQDVERSMGRIEVEAARMGGMVEDLLLLARLDQLPEAELHAVEATELAAHAADDARATAQSHELRFTADGPHWVLADPDGLRQVLANLLRNASIHTPPGTEIELSVAAAGGRVLLQVRDHGPGLPQDAGDQVFERFWRGERGRTRGPGGAGLGLAIVKAIVTAHHGEVHAENAPGGGARFTVSLPATNPPDSANTQPPHTVRISDSATVRR